MAAAENHAGPESPVSEVESEPPYIHVLSAFLAMEPPDYVISLARECIGDSITGSVQRVFWENCVKAAANGNTSYAKKFLKKLISEIELENGEVLDELYEEYALYMSSSKDDETAKESIRVCKVVSFLFPEGLYEHPSCPRSRKLVIPLKCSLNMLEGDTGCSVWPSSLFLSEFVLSFPDFFAGKTCFEVGSGVGLVGICLAHVKASKVILTDGDLLTLTNMKLNLEVNHLNYDDDLAQQSGKAQSTVKCVHLPWETASDAELQEYNPDIILGADVIYDPSCLPHLVRVLATLLQKRPSHSAERDNSPEKCSENEYANAAGEQEHAPVAYIASVIRNADTFNVFLKLLDQTELSITDITEKLKPLEFLPYMRSYDRSSVQLFSISSR
ncbi:PREDICTED: putative uncharacterized protein DDB_G0277003 [Tarenaya hassleriana]|uniref:putative uncharacterized protein DDB_G0277003 n=1 Tax=Tarenaya hassleriana TaxID=28532 RepID=UPI00053C3F57|nr:PREDICTED: putative uncharacterized protein DDB_G0277003 [Tarenaya hassleriana]XP_010546669.1 PREDICTED: putative uncharacterized protein DDB_G0277003 [Tarenaya hassleriana]